MNGRWKAYLFVGLIFAAGVLTGVALTIVNRPNWNHPPSPGTIGRHWIHDLTNRLSLSADQQIKIEPIINDAQKRIGEVHRDEVGKITAIFQATDGQINPLLTPDQQQKFLKMQQERPPEFPHRHHFDRGPEDRGPDERGMPPGPPPAPGDEIHSGAGTSVVPATANP